MKRLYSIHSDVKTILVEYLNNKPRKDVDMLCKILETKETFEIDELNALVNYLTLNPYREVFKFIEFLKDDLAKQDQEHEKTEKPN